MFSIHNRSDIDQVIRRDLDIVVAAIDATLIAYHSIYLTGSFGRGEGTVEFDGSRWRAVNDYDVLVICPDDLHVPSCIKNLGKDLARLLEIDFVDVGCVRRSSLNTLPPTIQNYDLKYASFLLAGEELREAMPQFHPGQIPPYEFVRLLCNRAAGLLTTRLPERAQFPRYCRNQYVKACIAAGDTAVYLAQGYESSYAARWQAFHGLAENRRMPFSLSSEAIDCIVKAYETKLSFCSIPSFVAGRALLQEIMQNAFCAITERCTEKQIASVLDAEKALHGRFGTAKSAAAIRRTVFGSWRREEYDSTSMNSLILFSQPVFFCQARSGVQERLAYLSRFSTLPGAREREWNSNSAVLMWEEYCH